MQKTHMANGKWWKIWRIGHEAWVVSGIDLLSAIGLAVEAEARKSAKGKPFVRLTRQRLMNEPYMCFLHEFLPTSVSIR